MRAKPFSYPLPTALLLAMSAAGCGGDGGGPAGPEGPELATTLSLDFERVRVLEDCDGIEGAGDFRFLVQTLTGAGVRVTHLNTVVNYDPGDTTADLGTHVFPLDVSEGRVEVSFEASELDTGIGGDFNDSRMDQSRGWVIHRYVNGQWTHVGRNEIDLGSGDCWVDFSYVALVIPPS